MITRLYRAAPLALCLAALHPLTAQTTAAPTAQPFAELTAEQWREDLRFMVAELEHRHANLYHSISRQAFAAAVADLDARIPRLQRNQVIVGMMRLAAMIGDGHTRIDPRKDDRFGFPSLPLKLYLFEDGLYVRAAAPGHARLVGARVVAIGNVPVAEAIRRAAELASRDNEIGPRLFVPLYLAMPDILHALDLGNSRREATLTLSRAGRTWTERVSAGEVEPRWPPDTDISLATPQGWVDARTTPQPPLWLQAPLDYHRLVALPEHDALYAQLNMVADIEGQSLTDFGRRIRERAAATGARAVILDLRLNQGGGGHLRYGFVRELIRTQDEDTRLFVLTWRGTFSASQFILDDLDRLTDAVFIGEPAGTKPSHYGDAYRMPLPHSGITLRSSIYYWQLEQNRDPWTWVDVATPFSFADYAAGRDPALAAALAYTSPPPLADRLFEVSRTADPARLRQAVEHYWAAPANLYANRTRNALRAAEALNGQGRTEGALAVAQLVAERVPDSVWAAYAAARYAQAVNRNDLARQWVRRVLELDPDHRDARSMLERLGPER